MLNNIDSGSRCCSCPILPEGQFTDVWQTGHSRTQDSAGQELSAPDASPRPVYGNPGTVQPWRRTAGRTQGRCQMSKKGAVPLVFLPEIFIDLLGTKPVLQRFTTYRLCWKFSKINHLKETHFAKFSGKTRSCLTLLPAIRTPTFITPDLLASRSDRSWSATEEFGKFQDAAWPEFHTKII